MQVLVNKSSKNAFFINEAVASNVKADKRSANCNIYPIEQVIKPFDFNRPTKNLIIVRHGGIGDLIALSSLVDFIYKNTNIRNIHFFAGTNYWDLFKYYAVPVKLRDQSKPAFVYDAKTRLNLNSWSQLNFEGSIENAKGKNWFELFFEIANAPFSKEHGRPIMVNNIAINEQKKDKILICPQSSANIRSIDENLLVNAIREVYPNKVIESNISKGNPAFSDLKTFLEAVSSYGLIVSVDPGALHFREAMGGFGIGLYNAFSAECRTKYYTNTKSYDIISDCLYQPCFFTCKAKRSPMFKYEILYGESK